MKRTYDNCERYFQDLRRDHGIMVAFRYSRQTFNDRGSIISAYLEVITGKRFVLTGLKEIDWQSLNAAQMPQWIIGLTATDRGERIRAGMSLLKYFREHAKALGIPEEYKELLSTDAPVLVTPFLIELLSSPEIQDKGRILHILTVLAGYRSISGLEDIHQTRAKNIYQFLLEKFDLFPPFLESDDSYARIHTMYLINQFSERAHLVVDYLINRIEADKEENEEAKVYVASIIFERIQSDQSIAQLYTERFTNILQRWVANYFESLSIQASAAFYLIRFYGDKAEESIVKILSNILKVPSYHTLDIPLLNDCADAFMQLGKQRGTDALLSILDAQTTLTLIFDTATILLGIHFGAEDYHRIYLQEGYLGPKNFTIHVNTAISPVEKPSSEEQKKVLSHLLAKEEIWEVESNLFEAFLLPNSKLGLQLLIDEI